MADGGGYQLLRPPVPAPPPPPGSPEARKPKVVWQPLPGSQELVLACPCNEIFYEGTRGPGKTDTQLMKFRRYVGIGYGRHWRGVIFDREYKNLDDLVSKSYRWFQEFGDGAYFMASKSDLRWVWPTGEELLFRQIKRTQDYWKYHGQEFPFIGWNELTKYPTPELYEMMKSCNRSSYRPEDHPLYFEDESTPRFLPEIPLIIMSTSNPFGAGHNWVKRYFIDPAEPGVIIKTKIDVFNPRTQRRELITKTRVRIFGSYKENKYLAPEYVATLEAITDPNKRRAWLWGDWDIVSGGAFDDLWGEHLKKPRFKVPAGWRVDRSFDWGSTKPFSIGWWAEADGTAAIMPNGQKWCPPKGTIVRIFEWYGTVAEGTNKGILLSVKQTAAGIKKIEKKLRDDGWISAPVHPGPADSQIFVPTESGEKSIGEKFKDEGVPWKEANDGPHSRKNGLQLMRDLFEEVKTAHDNGTPLEGPGIYFTTNCRAAISTLPVLPRDEDDPDDVDTDAEDHCYDECRYRVLAKFNRAVVTPLRTR